MRLAKIGLVSLVTASWLFAGTYNVDIAHSNVGFKVKHMMISNVVGSFDKFSGTFEYDEKTKTIKSLVGDIDASSINTSITKRDEHLKSPDFFDVAKYPSIKFNLTKIKGDVAYGKLTMHGITKDVKLQLENNGMIKDPSGNTRVGITLNGTIERKDFGLTYNSVLEAGGIAIGDKVKLEVEIEGILQK
ncbi:MAG: YceI family protein [Arcobacteraceae bacterium]|nr:YceI family protein [Arcobacteraceae bacterium]